MFWLYLIIGLTSDTISMYFGKKYVLTDNINFLIITLLLYLVMGLSLIQMFRYKELTIVNILWIVGVLVTGTLIGQLIFKESITLVQWIGIIICIIGVILIQIPGK